MAADYVVAAGLPWLSMSCRVKILNKHKAQGPYENPEHIYSFIKRVLHFQLQNSGNKCLGLLVSRYSGTWKGGKIQPPRKTSLISGDTQACSFCRKELFYHFSNLTVKCLTNARPLGSPEISRQRIVSTFGQVASLETNELNLLLIPNGVLPHSSACCLALQLTVVRERYHPPLWRTETFLRQHKELRWKSRSCITNETRTRWRCRNLATPVCSKAKWFPNSCLVAFGSHRELATWTIVYISLPMGTDSIACFSV